SFPVPAFPGNGGLSFLGVVFNAGERVARAEITTGTAALGPNDLNQGGPADEVAMDDFIYAEPQPLTPGPQNFVVTTANDAGFGSLRNAITAANNTPGPDQISFDIPGGGVQTITLLSSLPTISNPVA